ncbi:tryptophan synthase beta subunit-like PLP-dependent enzyme [Xylaria bambusicola]|uniref:tryptophan synthase beta subunit-like PLP-dependent enzyme n=1 Tax=Xylaria bambusicola TaxID=326684 RepID=UPI002008D91F|nr:tryptophan synthase beta subunit-like PLP-dependent enzyme [Xylaria bambusicola]KAI0514377.1 tryptophan synthase beta subunit-like PLP-dependent enzyme [Xylaria bambusicola]
MGSFVPDLPKLHMETPCIQSQELSRAAGCNIYLKLENLQPSGSFKSRGIGTMMSRALLTSSSGRAHFHCSSGGNAGLACAEAARTLRQPCDVFLSAPTPDIVMEKLAALGATPHRATSGAWPEADALCRAAVESNPDGVYVPPFDHPSVWDGNSTIVDELASLEAKGFFSGNGDGNGVVNAIVCSVGGGGLLNGVMEGIERNYGSPRPAVLAIETSGADSLAASIRAEQHVSLPGITSVATTLGAPRVSAQTYQWAQRCNASTFTLLSPQSSSPLTKPSPTKRSPEHSQTRLTSAVVSDAAAVSACARFLDDARFLVEVACGATLSAAYNSQALLRVALAPDADDASWARTNVVLVVCGGASISFDMLAKYREKFGV